MGSRGIRRRKPARHLPPVREVDPDDDIPPNIMWPPKGSGFQADPFSPAGTSQRYWLLIRRQVGTGGSVSFRAYLILMSLLVVAVAIALVVTLR
jgi:hypothetical protein